MIDWVVVYVATAVAFLIADGLWLGVIMKSFYMDRLAPIKREPMKKLPAGVFYLFYTAGLVILAIQPLGEPVVLVDAAWRGALIGFLAYGTYNMTNASTLAQWPMSVSAIDWPWGTFATGLASVCGALIYNAWLA